MSSSHLWLVSDVTAASFHKYFSCWELINHHKRDMRQSQQISSNWPDEARWTIWSVRPPSPPPPCPEPCHYCHVGDRCRELTITNSIIRSVNCSHHHSTTTTSSSSSQALITQHQLLPTRQNCKEESRNQSDLSSDFVTETESVFPSLSPHSFDVWYCVVSSLLSVLSWCLICHSDGARVVCNYPRRDPSYGSDQMVSRTNEVVTTDGIKGVPGQFT